MPDHPEQTVLLPDPQARRRAAVLLGVVAVVGSAVIIVSQSYLAALTQQAATMPEVAIERFRTFVRNFALLGSFGLLAVAVWLRSFAQQALEEERFPPSTARVIRPTPVVTGYPARLRARFGLLCSFLLIVSAMALPISLLSLFAALEASLR
ncbi:MAG: hypothetical protein E4H03_04785 [Myxococcales bacterium]|jgi:hypothetical protein|nr:MAG: hypothetical protein E4H03_04785 [Myxococcales bacterium]